MKSDLTLGPPPKKGSQVEGHQMSSNQWIFVHRSTPGIRGTNASSIVPAWIAHHAGDKEVYITGNLPSGGAISDLTGFPDDRSKNFVSQRLLALKNPEARPIARAREVAKYVRDRRAELLVVYSHPRVWIYPILRLLGVIPWSCKLVLDIRSHITADASFKKKALQVANMLTLPLWNYVHASSTRNCRSYFLGFAKPGIHPIGISPQARRTLDRSRTHGKLRVCYAGTLSKARSLHRMLFVLIDAVKTLDFEVSIEIFGDGGARPELEKLVASMDASSFVLFHGQLPLSDMAGRISQCDVGINFLAKRYSGAPSLKRLEYAAQELVILENMNTWSSENPEGFESLCVRWQSKPVATALTDALKMKTQGTGESLHKNRELAMGYSYDEISERLVGDYRAIISKQSQNQPMGNRG